MPMQCPHTPCVRVLLPAHLQACEADQVPEDDQWFAPDESDEGPSPVLALTQLVGAKIKQP
jgi:hypothetical protein